MLGTATLEGISSRLDNPDEWISELEDRVVEITQGEKKNEFFKVRAGLPWWLSGNESACQYKRCGFNPRSGKIPHAKEQLSPCATNIEPVL